MESGSQMIANLLKHAHSGLRWIVLIALVWAIFNAFTKWRGQQDFKPADKGLNLFAMISVHLQFTLGLLLYFVSPKVVFAAESMKDPLFRFFLVEHLTIMLIGLVVVTIGHGRSKRATESALKFKTTFIFYLIGLVLILAGIPWPPKHGAGWF
jgi:putative Ca2+/H+ antiporter (TMEM165/GDT1 family)